MAIYDFTCEDYGLISKTVNAFLPKKVIIPLVFDNEKQDSAEIFICEGETVREGQVIARANDSTVHSSIPGTVDKIFETDFADGRRGLGALISLKGSFSYTGKIPVSLDWTKLEQSTLRFLIADCGIINTFGKNTPLARQLSSFSSKAWGAVICRLFPDDPGRITENVLTENYIEKIITGTMITAKALGAKAIVFARDNTQKEIDFSKIEKIDENLEIHQITLDGKDYPSGFPHELIQAVKNQLKNSEVKKCGCNELFIDCQTALNVYNGIVEGKPEIFSYIHVSGDCLNAAGVFKVKIGTLLSDFIEQCGNFKKKPAKIIINGKITGWNVASFNLPVTKGIKSISFIPKNQIPDEKKVNCIRCGSCHSICPVGLYPETLLRCGNDEPKDILVKQTALLCTECGLCNSVCPSRIELCQLISNLKTAKKEVTVDELK